MKLGVKTIGLRAVRDRIKKQTAKTKKDFSKGLYEAGLYVMAEAKKNTPVGDTGNLVGSARITPPNVSSNPTVTVYYVASYALFVHENLEARHGLDRKPNPGGSRQKARFLALGLTENIEEIKKIIAKRTGLR